MKDERIAANGHGNCNAGQDTTDITIAGVRLNPYHWWWLV